MDGYCKVAGQAAGTRSAPGATLHHRTLTRPLTKHHCRALSLNRLFQGWFIYQYLVSYSGERTHSTVASAGNLGWILLQNGQFAMDTLLAAALVSND